MATATIALRTRPRPLLGPALGPRRLPIGTLLLSTALHALALGGLVVFATLWQDPPTKTYVVNLVPAIAAVGTPLGRASAPTPTLPPRPSELTQPTKTAPKPAEVLPPPKTAAKPTDVVPATKSAPKPAEIEPPKSVAKPSEVEPPPKPVAKATEVAPPKTLPKEPALKEARTTTPLPETPSLPSPRDTMSLPDRTGRIRPSTRDTAALPDRSQPTRPSTRENASLPDPVPPLRVPALPRPSDKELPPAPPPRMTSESPLKREIPSTISPAPTRAPSDALTRADAPPPPPPPAPLGQIAGSAQGSGTVTLSVSDFPYAWYIQAIHRKIQERWQGHATEGRQPEVIFEIGSDGQLRRLVIGKSSGNAAYDQFAMRAVGDSNPFPPLPAGFGKSTLTVGLQFIYDPRAR